MAHGAIGSGRIPRALGLAMHSTRVLGRHLGVALSALRLGNAGRMWEVLVPRVAGRTFHRGMGAALDLLTLFVTGGTGNP